VAKTVVWPFSTCQGTYPSCKIRVKTHFVCVGAYDFFSLTRDLAPVKNPGGIKAFGRHLRAVREARSLSLKELGDLANVDKSSLHRIEVGIASPNLDLLISVARALHLPIHELMNNDAITSSDSGLN
jgi:DNA-binding XRE family transcriptional regulator